MKAYLTTNPLGVFAFDEKGGLLAKALLQGKPDKVARKLKEAENALIEEEEKVIAALSGREVVIEKPCYLQGVQIQNPNPGGEYFRRNLATVLVELDYSEEKYRAVLHAVCLGKARIELEEAAAMVDKHLIQATACLQELDETVNALAERAREWQAWTTPSHEEATAEQEELLTKMTRSDNSALRDFARVVMGLQEYRGGLEGHINETMEVLAPNLAALTGPLLGARLISLAKGLENLASMPGSRIQILGAGGAFFKGKRKKRLPPKHGAIFQHPLIKGAPWWQRGKISRSLGSKIAIAARVDAFSENYIGDKLRDDFNERVERIRHQYPDEPKKMRIIRRTRK